MLHLVVNHVLYDVFPEIKREDIPAEFYYENSNKALNVSRIQTAILNELNSFFEELDRKLGRR